MQAPRYQCFSHQINNRQPQQQKKSKSWELLWSYQLKSSANPTHSPQKWNWQCCLAGSYKMAPRILIFSIVLGAEYLCQVKSIETHVLALLTINILSIGTVLCLVFLQVQNYFELSKPSWTDWYKSFQTGPNHFVKVQIIKISP